MKLGKLAKDLKSWSNSAGIEVAVRRIYRSRPGRRVIYFLHIGKAAGSQVKQALHQINQHENGILMRAMTHDVSLKDIPADAEYFFSVRDPVSRFRSGFYSRKRRGRPLNDFAWTAHEAQAFHEFEHANTLAEALFEPGTTGMKAVAAMKSIEHTAQDQIDWFVLAGDIFAVHPPVWIVRQEHFGEDFDAFLSRARIGFRPELRRDSVGSHSNDYANVPPLSDEAKDKLRRWYAQDYAFYDACETWMEQNRTSG